MWMMLLCLWMQNARGKGLFIKERVDILYESGRQDSFHNQYWLSKNRIRTDPDGEDLTLIYDNDLHLFYMIDHKRQNYTITKISLDRRDARLNLLGLASFQDGVLQKRPNLVQATGKRKKIEKWVCEEYILNYPEQSGMETHIWATYHPAMTKNFHKKLWYAALGTSPPGDVRHILNEILRNIHGIPVQITTSVSMEDHQVTTISTLTDIVEFDEFEDFMAVPTGYSLNRGNP